VKAVILAAGSSTRLYPLTHNVPKCLLEIAGKTLLAHQLAALAACNVDEVVLVVGYLADVIRQALSAVPAVQSVSLVDNPQYASTNNLHSLWVAREQLRGSPFLCLHADVLFHPQILEGCLHAEHDICLMVDREIHQETMKVAISSGTVVRIGKEIEPEAVAGTFTGIARCSAEGGRMLLEEADALVQAGETGVYFTAAVERLAQRGLAVGFSTTDGFPWIEIDFPEELERARREVYPAIAAHTAQPRRGR
jgi:choline kinase